MQTKNSKLPTTIYANSKCIVIIFTNIWLSDYPIVKTTLNVKGFMKIEIYFQCGLIALNDVLNGS
jgi:hypothetical protein